MADDKQLKEAEELRARAIESIKEGIKKKKELEEERESYRNTLASLAKTEIFGLRVMIAAIEEMEREGEITRGEYGEIIDYIQKLDKDLGESLKRLSSGGKKSTEELDKEGKVLHKAEEFINAFFADFMEAHPRKGEGSVSEGQNPEEEKLNSLYNEAADTISNKTTPIIIKASRRLAETIAHAKKTPEEMERLATEEQKNYLQVAGLSEGLAGLNAYTKKFLYSLVIILCKQSQQYGDKELGGINRVLRENFDKTMSLADDNKGLPETERREGNNPQYPIIAIRYRDIANFMGIEVQGGRDLRQIQEMIDDLDKRRYYISYKNEKGEERLIGKRILAKWDTLNNPKTRQEEGCILILGDIFAAYVKESYITFRSDLNKRLGRKKVKDITMNLFSLLLLGDRKKPYIVGKKRLLSEIGGDRPCYKSRNKKLEEDFKEAIEGVKATGLIKDVKGIPTPGGDDKLRFIYNPEYLEDTLLAAPK